MSGCFWKTDELMNWWTDELMNWGFEREVTEWFCDVRSKIVSKWPGWWIEEIVCGVISTERRRSDSLSWLSSGRNLYYFWGIEEMRSWGIEELRKWGGLIENWKLMIIDELMNWWDETSMIDFKTPLRRRSPDPDNIFQI